MVESIRNPERVLIEGRDAFGEPILVAQADTGAPEEPETGSPSQTAGTETDTTAPTRTVIEVENGEILRLPAEASVDQPRINGTDLEFVQPDGSIIVVPNGAITGLTIFIGDVEIPAQTVATLFEANGIETAAGPGGPGNARGSGGNFEVPVGGIGDAFNIGDLLPPTALAFARPENRELFEGLLDDEPTIGANGAVFLDDDNLVGSSGFGLLALNEESHSVSGQLVFDYGRDGEGSVLLTGATFPPELGLTFQIENGGALLIILQDGRPVVQVELTDTVSGDFVVTQLDNILHPDGTTEDEVAFSVSFTVTDGNGDAATGSLQIIVDDDVPEVFLEAVDYRDGQSEGFNPIQLQLDETVGKDRAASDEITDGNGADDDVGGAFDPINLTMSVDGATDKAFGALGTQTGSEGGNGALAGMFNSMVWLGADDGEVFHDFALKLTGAGAEGEAPSGVATSLKVTALDGTPFEGASDEARTIFLFQEADGSVTGRVGGPEGYIALRITIEGADDPSTAALKVYQLIPLEHGDEALHDEQIALALVGNGEGDSPALTVDYTIRAVDGDTDEASANASITLADTSSTNATGAIVFDDDGPMVQVTANEGFALSHDESLLPQGDADDLVLSEEILDLFAPVQNVGVDPHHPLGRPLGYAESETAALTLLDVDFGSDGAAQSGAMIYSLTLIDEDGQPTDGPLDSGLETTDGTAIYLYNEGGFIVGRYEDDGVDRAAFAIRIGEDGKVGMLQYVSLEHPDNLQKDEDVSLADMEGGLHATVTVTDGDGDKASASVDIGGAISFQDDGPNIVASPRLNFGLLIDETAGNQAQSDDVTGPLSVFDAIADKGVDLDSSGPLGFAVETRSPIFFIPIYGVDGPGTTPVDYALNVTNTVSGLAVTDGSPIVLVAETDGTNTWIVGRVQGGDFDGDAAFALHIDPVTGHMSVVQYLSLDHVAGNPNDVISLASGSISATVTITDGDGDYASRTFDISGKVSFRDDGPTMIGNASFSAAVDEDGLGIPANLSDGNEDGAPARPGEVSGSGSNVYASADGALQSLVNFGVDGFGSFSIKTTAAAATAHTSKGEAIVVSGSGSTLYGYVEGAGGSGYQAGDRLIFTLELQPDGSFTFTLNDQIDHPTLNGLAGDNSENLLTSKIDLSAFVEATDGDGDTIPLGAGSFSIDVRDDIPVVSARDAGETSTTETETLIFDLKGGNDVVGGIITGSTKGLWVTGDNLSGNDDTANTSNNSIGIGQGQSIDEGPEVLTVEFFENVDIPNGGGTPTHGDAYEANVFRFKIDAAEKQQNDDAVVFIQVLDVNGNPILPANYTVSAPAGAIVHDLYVGGIHVGFVFENVPDNSGFTIASAAGFSGVKIGNYNGFTFDGDAAGTDKTLSTGNSFKVYDVGADVHTTIVTTETFNVVHDETVGVDADADDIAGPFAPGVIGIARSSISVLDPGSLFSGTVGADEDGVFTFAITDADGNPFDPLDETDSGLKTLSGDPILIHTDVNGDLIGSADGVDIFRVSVDEDGFVLVTQYEPIAHDLDGSSTTAFDDGARITAALHITATLTDFDGDAVSATSPVALVVEFQDDGPVAYANVNTITEGSTDPVTGNVLTDDVDDKLGTDGGSVTGIRLGTEGAGGTFTAVGNAPTIINGAYGQLTLNADGSYSYQLTAASIPVDVTTETFTYRITDGDGDFDLAELVITLNQDQRVPEVSGDTGIVYENGLPGGTQEGTANETDTTGTFQLDANGEAFTLTIAGTNFTSATLIAGPFPMGNVDTGEGLLTLTGYNAGTGEVSYSYTLKAPLTHSGQGVGTNLTDTIPVTVTDATGDSASTNLIIAIVDDLPGAVGDTQAQATENDPVVVDVFTNDTAGADGVDLATGIALVDGSLSGSGSLVYNGDGTFTYTPASGEEGEVTFEYEITDGDGDTSRATVTIGLEDDSTPSVSVVSAQGDDGVVWESALLDGSGGGDLTAQGSLNIVHSGADTTAKIEVQDKDGIWVEIAANGTIVQGVYGQVSVNTDGSWTYTLGDNTLDHDELDQTGGDDQVQDAFAVRVTDSDGDVTDGSAQILVQINDDGPSAVGDTQAQATENDPVVVDVFTNDTAGADGVDLATGIALVDGSLSGSGSLVYNGDGTFTYTPASGEEGEVTFEYEITDGDGDTSRATVTIGLEDDSTPSVSVVSAQGDDGVVWESALLDGSGGGDLTAQGSLNIVHSGADTTAKIEVQDKDGIWVEIAANGTIVQGVYGQVSVNTDGSWTYTLGDNTLDHDELDQTGGDDQVQDAFAVRVTDSDGDVTDGSAQILVQINDDGPSFIAADYNGATAGNGVSPTVSTGSTSATGDLVFQFGADGPKLPAEDIVFGTNTAPAGLTYTIVGNELTATINAGGAEAFTVVLNADDSFDFEITQAGLVFFAGASPTPLTFNVLGVDGDGDSAPGSFTVNVDGYSAPTGSEDPALVTVDEAALDLVEDANDLAAGEVIGTSPTSDAESSSTAVSFTAGSLALTTFAFATPTGGNAPVISGLDNLGSVSWSVDLDGRLVGTIGGTVAIILAIAGGASIAAETSGTVDVEVTLTDAFPHENSPDADSLVISNIVVTASDGVTTVSSTVNVTVLDDEPVFDGVMNAVVGNENNTVVTGLHGLSLGTDGLGSIDVEALTAISGVTYLPVVDLVDGSARLTAQVNGTDFFILTVKPDGTYDFELINARASVPESFTFGSVSGGQSTVQFTVGAATFSAVDSNGDSQIGSAEELKPTSNGFGIANANLNPGEEFRVSFPSAIESVNFTVNKAGGPAFSMIWVTSSGESGTVSTTTTGLVSVNPTQDFTWIEFSVTGGQAKLDTFGYSKLVIPGDMQLEFDISGVDADGDPSVHQTLQVELLGSSSTNMEGSSGDDVIGGTSLANTLSGLAGDDILSGLAGNDILTGGDGDDILIGGLGTDTMTGGNNADTFVIGSDSGTGAIKDIIADYDHAEGDIVDLSALLDDALIDSGNVGQYVRVVDTGADGNLQVDLNGATGGANWVDVATLTGNGTIGASIDIKIDNEDYTISVTI
jgi:T1SS-143 domain-containing protein